VPVTACGTAAGLPIRVPAGAARIWPIVFSATRGLRSLVFVEVKSRATDEFGTPDRAVDPEKQAHIERAGREYARRAGVDWDTVRFDIVNVLLTRPPQVELLRDAFGPKRTI
jgi:Holliday junction resolvase-like predicted endonuclease